MLDSGSIELHVSPCDPVSIEEDGCIITPGARPRLRVEFHDRRF